jgi:DNA polymerase I-like protein with 3'-5' exonuclease and polymerase domains
VAADYNGQEMRIMAHFAEGRAAEIYRNNPRADFHSVAKELIKEHAGLDLPRKDVKITGFSLIYGAGVNSLSEQLGVGKDVAKRIRDAYFKSLPGLQELMWDVQERGDAGKPVKSWGGRIIYPEAPKVVNGQHWTFSYKLLNHLIQGSAADQTKEAIIQHGYRSQHARFMITVHDENVYSVRPEALPQAVKDIKASMEDQHGWDVPFIAEVEVGPNWHDLESYK